VAHDEVGDDVVLLLQRERCVARITSALLLPIAEQVLTPSRRIQGLIALESNRAESRECNRTRTRTPSTIRSVWR
jgi:hypothetical protein